MCLNGIVSWRLMLVANIGLYLNFTRYVLEEEALLCEHSVGNQMQTFGIGSAHWSNIYHGHRFPLYGLLHVRSTMLRAVFFFDFSTSIAIAKQCEEILRELSQQLIESGKRSSNCIFFYLYHCMNTDSCLTFHSCKVWAKMYFCMRLNLMQQRN